MRSFADTAKLLEEVRDLRARAARTIHESILLRLQSERAIQSLRAAIQDSHLVRCEGYIKPSKRQPRV